MDLQALGSRIETIETKMDATIAQGNQSTDCIQDLHNQLDVAMGKINDLENRSRWYNFRIRGLPESITDVPEKQSVPSSKNSFLRFIHTCWNLIELIGLWAPLIRWSSHISTRSKKK